MLLNTAEYLSIIENIKSEITAAQYRAAVHVNADMLLLYYDIGCVINEHKSWGNKFIDNYYFGTPDSGEMATGVVSINGIPYKFENIKTYTKPFLRI